MPLEIGREKMEEMVPGSSGTGHQQMKTVWVVNTRVADKPHSSAIHTSKQTIVTNRGDQNTLKYMKNCNLTSLERESLFKGR